MSIADLSRKLALPLTDCMPWRPAWQAVAPFQQHAPFSFWLAQALKPESFVALASPASVAQLSVCQAVQRLNLGTRCYGIAVADTAHGGDAAEAQRLAWHEDQYSLFSRVLRKPLQDALHFFRPAEIDWLHVDDMAILGQLKADWPAWQARLSARAVITVHGSALREPLAAAAFLQDLRQRFPALEFIHGEGLTLLCIGPRRNKSVNLLMSSAAEARLRQPLLSCFARLGQSCMDACKPAAIQPEPARPPAKAQNENPAHGNDQLKARLTQAEAALAESQTRLQAAEKRASSEAERANRLDAACKAAQQAQKAAETQATNATGENEKRLAALQAELKQAQATIQQQARRLDDRFRELGTLTALIEERNKELDTLRAAASARPGRSAEVLSPAAQLELVARSGLFDSDWYLATYPDVARRRESPLQHFMLHGAAEGRNPSASFDTTWYCRTYPDVQASGLNPLLHFIRIGKKEGRQTCARRSAQPQREREQNRQPERIHG